MTTKITVSLPDEHVAALKAAVRDGDATSVSAAVARAVGEWTEKESLAEFLAHLETVHGPIPVEDRKWAHEALRNA